MKKITAILLALSLCLVLSACGKSGVMYDLPDDAKNFAPYEYIDPCDDTDSYMGVEYCGRYYVAFGAQAGTVHESDLEACIGYIDGDKNSRVYTLKETPDLLATYYINGEMEQFAFIRALDTADRDIPLPDYVYDQHYPIWG